jgi:two-component system, NtrC family, sensor kinase
MKGLKGLESQFTVWHWMEIMDAIPDLVALINDDHRFMMVNKALADALGSTPDDLKGRRCWEIMHGSDHPPANCPHLKVLSDNKAHIDRIEHEKFGSHYLTSAVPLFNADRQFMACLHVSKKISKDIGSITHAEQPDEETQWFMSTMSSFMVKIDSKLKITRWNHAAERIFGKSENEVIGLGITGIDFGFDWTNILAMVPSWREGELLHTIKDYPYRRCDGTLGCFEARINVIKDDDGGHGGYLVIGDDTTEERHVEMGLRLTQKLNGIGVLASGIAHEINTPTQYISDNLNFLQLASEEIAKFIRSQSELLAALQDEAPDDRRFSVLTNIAEEINLPYLAEQVPQAIKQSFEGISEVSSLLRVLKEFSRTDTEKATNVNVAGCIKDTLLVSRNMWSQSADVITEFQDDLPLISCDPGSLNHALLSIIINAAQAIEDHSGTSNGRGTIRIEAWGDAGHVLISISDTGTGIDESVKDRIYEPFFTTRDSGQHSGLGLMMAYSVIVNKHGGSLEFEPREDGGTVFLIRLPVDGG